MGGDSELRGEGEEVGQDRVCILFWGLQQETEDVAWGAWEATGAGTAEGKTEGSLGPAGAQVGGTGSGCAIGFSVPACPVAGRCKEIPRQGHAGRLGFHPGPSPLAATCLHPPPSP